MAGVRRSTFNEFGRGSGFPSAIVEERIPLPLGEAKAIELIARIARRRNPEVVTAIGDDAAVLRGGLVVTTDAYIEGVHFDRAYMDLSAVGARAMCGTLSDIAAMSARPIAVFVSLMLPRGIGRRDISELYQGMDAICGLFRTEIAGGDIVSAPQLGLALTALGQAKSPRLRSGAKPGDWVYVTGHCALAETGRLALKHGLDPRRYRHAIERHVCPIPRIRESLKLASAIHGLIDTSDGLSTDAGHIACESRVKLVIEADRLPIHDETRRLCAELNLDLMQFVVSSGEDYELLFTSARKEIQNPKSKIQNPLFRIGRVEKGRGVWLVSDRTTRRLPPTGYDHLRSGSGIKE